MADPYQTFILLFVTVLNNSNTDQLAARRITEIAASEGVTVLNTLISNYALYWKNLARRS